MYPGSSFGETGLVSSWSRAVRVEGGRCVGIREEGLL